MHWSLQERRGTGTLKHKDMSLNRSAIRVLDSADQDLPNWLTHMVSSNDFHVDVEEVAELAEQFIMDRMSPADTAAYVAHAEGCSVCIQAIEEAVRFVSGIRAAASQLESQRKKLAAASRR